MKALKLYISFCISAIFIGGGALVAQDAQAEKILDTSKKTFESLSDFSATYTYELNNKAMKSDGISKNGRFRYKSGMYFLDLGNQAIYCDLESQWIHLKDDEEVTIVEYDPEEAVNIESVYKMYESNAKSTYQGEEMLNGRKTHKILLTSLDGGLEYNQVTVWINMKSNLVEKAVLVDRNQSEEIIRFDDIKTNLGFSLADFQFDSKKFPAVDIYDER